MKIIGLDTETTGLLEPDHRIIEVAMLLYDSDSEQLTAKYVQRINPQRPISLEAQQVHGITFEEVAMLPPFEDFADKIADILSLADLVVGHNCESFDLPFVKQELNRVGKAMPKVMYVDTMTNARWATPFGKLPNLEELCFSTGIPYDRAQAHAAEYDVDVMMKAFFAGVRKGFFTLEGRAFE